MVIDGHFFIQGDGIHVMLMCLWSGRDEKMISNKVDGSGDTGDREKYQKRRNS